MTRVLRLVLCVVAVAIVATLHAATATITLSPTIEDVNFGQLVNAPNGHVSFERNDQGFRIWLPGRDPVPETFSWRRTRPGMSTEE